MTSELAQQLHDLVSQAPQGLSCSQLCRAVNQVPLHTCYACCDYGNAWKRARGILRRPSCRIRKGRVWRGLQALEHAGVVFSQREKRPDGDMVRGWDLMRMYYKITSGRT